MLQLLTGISSTRYWLVNFLVDFVTYNIACFAAFLPIYVGDPNNLHGREYSIISRYYFLFASFGWSFIPTTYVISSSVETPTVAYFALIVESFITGTVTSIVLFLFAKDLVIKQAERGNYHKLITKLEFPMRMMPNFAVNRGFGAINRELISQLICCNFPLDLQRFLCRHSRGEHVHIIFSQNETEYWDRLAKSCPNICEHSERHIAQSDDCYFDRLLPPQVISDNNWDLIVMGITGLVLLAVTIFFDAKFQSKTKSHELMSREELRLKRAQVHLLDPTVIEERDRVEDLVQAMVHGEEDGLLGLLVHKLGKTYGDTNIINQLSFTVQPGEIFGVLGLQQSGRSTVLGILAGDRELGRGNAYIEGWGIRRNPKQHRPLWRLVNARFSGLASRALGDCCCRIIESFYLCPSAQYLKRVGYCPEEDPLILKLTGREMLNLIGRLRGISGNALNKEVQYVLHQVGLLRHAKRLTMDYGSGSRRKLALAMSLVGDPAVVILDECTSGVDPISRGRLFRAITRIQMTSGMAVLFTSHWQEPSWLDKEEACVHELVIQ
ncbi:hypothetical protein HPB47_023315 [Ixodes persulcatus]|uniref:Uncharacterized protein n=1 Tax=Ixodes persulcatus TaxID=34615 RepID=A0AC60Q9D3_IXOPE|nr:hypothetical protein HPB47_023315 [Ixodes persulcatus]